MNSESLKQACAQSTATLGECLDQEWDVMIPGMDWTVAATAAHIADTLLWYAIDSAAGPEELSVIDVAVRPSSPPTELLRAIAVHARLLGLAVDSLAPEDRGYHPFGLTDASGFAAMGCDEIVMHTYDAATGLGRSFRASDELSLALLTRLFPWAPLDGDPWETLLWANGRAALPDRPRLEKWRWHCRPLQEWDGTQP